MSIPTRSKLGALASVFLVFALIQLFPTETRNPPVEQDVPATPAARSVLRRACYDCHSNETRWPWYSRVAPVSWLVAHDVRAGREELNFSTWNRYDTKHRIELLAESWEEIVEGEMPPWFYLPAHRDAELSASDRASLRSWALSRRSSTRSRDDED